MVHLSQELRVAARIEAVRRRPHPGRSGRGTPQPHRIADRSPPSMRWIPCGFALCTLI